MTEAQIYSYGIPIILVLIASEVIYSSIYKLKYYTLRDSLAGLGLLAGNFIIGLFTKGSIFLAYVYLYQFRIITVDEILPGWMVWVLTFIIVDFVTIYTRVSQNIRVSCCHNLGACLFAFCQKIRQETQGAQTSSLSHVRWRGRGHRK